MKLLLAIIGIVIAHQILLFAPFTIFFTTPILNIKRSHEVSTHGLAKRLVIFSAGGVKESVFYKNLPNIKFLNKLINEGRALFGVGETYLPTHDTRANYIASTAGVYEDVLGMILKTNPVKIDTIFDRARKSFLFGSQNVIKLFDKNTDNIKTFPFIQKSKKYSNYEISSNWIFDRVKQFYKNYSFTQEESKIITFIHLESTDIVGHIFKPTSKEYLDMLIEIDKNISEVYRMIETIYPDHSTAYIFTSDHGISDFGRHDDNSIFERQVPFIAWGPGVQVYRRKQHIKQIDIAAYISSLIGIGIPKNNLGIVPQNFLKSSPTYKYQASCGNLKQMVEQYLIKREEVFNHTFFFKEDTQFTQETLTTLTKEVTRLAEHRRYDTAASMCLEHCIYLENEFLNLKLISIPSSSDDAIFGRFSNQEYQRAYTAMSLLLVAFFATDNITSFTICNINITIPSFFKIFSSTTVYYLLLLKKIIPLFVVTLAICNTLARKAGALYRFSILIMLLSNVMAFFMFLQLKDEGTLVEIGVALSNYIISITLSLLVFVLLNIGNLLMLWDCPNIRIFFQLQDPSIENEKKNKESV
uniref:GPI ethanolamine phosphate transferase 1 n=1 Tax=Strongyloides papillosus TaxID=174720 RepID=A0A0N5B704_STREA